jgi:hypothetical protein
MIDSKFGQPIRSQVAQRMTREGSRRVAAGVADKFAPKEEAVIGESLKGDEVRLCRSRTDQMLSRVALRNTQNQYQCV